MYICLLYKTLYSYDTQKIDTLFNFNVLAQFLQELKFQKYTHQYCVIQKESVGDDSVGESIFKPSLPSPKLLLECCKTFLPGAVGRAQFKSLTDLGSYLAALLCFQLYLPGLFLNLSFLICKIGLPPSILVIICVKHLAQSEAVNKQQLFLLLLYNHRVLLGKMREILSVFIHGTIFRIFITD